MAKGGARNRSGPLPDPKSLRSAAKGLEYTALPATYDGPVPEFPLPDASKRELALWAEAWTWPQANFWSLPSESWRQRTVALWVRTSVRAEDPDAGAALLAQLHRFADQAALTTAGMAEVGLKVAADELIAKRSTAKSTPKQPSARDRMKVVEADGA